MTGFTYLNFIPGADAAGAQVNQHNDEAPPIQDSATPPTDSGTLPTDSVTPPTDSVAPPMDTVAPAPDGVPNTETQNNQQPPDNVEHQMGNQGANQEAVVNQHVPPTQDIPPTQGDLISQQQEPSSENANTAENGIIDDVKDVLNDVFAGKITKIRMYEDKIIR